MKELRLTFTDAEFMKLKKARLKTTFRSWRDFVLYKCSNGVSVRQSPRTKIRSVMI